MNRKRLLVLLLVLPLNLAAQHVLTISNRDSIYGLGRHIYYLSDSNFSYKIDDVLRPELQKQFTLSHHDTPNLGGTIRSAWFKFTIHNKLSESLYLQLSYVNFDTVDVYIPDSTGQYVRKRSGLNFKFSSREWPIAKYIFQLGDVTDKPYTVYCNLHSPGVHFWVPFQVSTLPTLLRSNRHFEFFSVGIFSILVVMFLYNFCLLIITKQRLYGFYSFYVATAIIYNGYYEGHFAEWFEGLAWNRISFYLPGSLLYIGVVLFTNELLDLRRKVSWLYYFSYTILFSAIVALFSNLLPLWAPPLFVDYLNLSLAPYVLIAGIMCYLRYERILGSIFIAGWLPLLTIAFLFLLMRNGVFYNDFILWHGVGIAMTWEVVLFSLMLGYWFNRLRKDTIRLQNQNMKLISEHNSALELEVKSRTDQLVQKTNEVIHQQEEILAQRDELERQNHELTISKQIIDKHNLELESSVKHRTAELAQANAELKNRVHQLEQFGFITAHNLRGPVARVLGLAHILDIQKPMDAGNKEVLNHIITSIEDLDTVIHDLGEIINIQNHKDVAKEWVSVSQLFNKLRIRYADEARKLEIKLETSSEVEKIYSINIYLDSILDNLISNAIKYAATNRPPEITLKISSHNQHYYISIVDNGIGFEYDRNATKVFEPFQRFNTHTKGKGLGMFMVKTQVTMLGGTIQMHSKMGVGTKVEILLPILEEETP